MGPEELIAQAAGELVAGKERIANAGELLLQARAACPRGQFITFLVAAGINPRTARFAMQVARDGGALEEQREREKKYRRRIKRLAQAEFIRWDEGGADDESAKQAFRAALVEWRRVYDSQDDGDAHALAEQRDAALARLGELLAGHGMRPATAGMIINHLRSVILPI